MPCTANGMHNVTSLEYSGETDACAASGGFHEVSLRCGDEDDSEVKIKFFRRCKPGQDRISGESITHGERDKKCVRQSRSRSLICFQSSSAWEVGRSRSPMRVSPRNPPRPPPPRRLPITLRVAGASIISTTAAQPDMTSTATIRVTTVRAMEAVSRQRW